MEKLSDKVSADHHDNTFSAAMLVLLNVSSGFVLTVGCFGLIGYGAVAIFDWVAG
jgi:hypothetical protein